MPTPLKDSYIFPLSGIRIAVDLMEDRYSLGEPLEQGAVTVWPEVGPLPTEKLAHYSAQPELHPGCVVAIGAVDVAEKIFGIYGATAEPGDRTRIELWEPIDFCVLGGCMWAAELRQEQRWLRFVSSVSEEIWHRPDRSRPSETP